MDFPDFLRERRNEKERAVLTLRNVYFDKKPRVIIVKKKKKRAQLLNSERKGGIAG